MVAKTITLPNVRRLFIPDPGMILADADLSGADAQVVAWEAGDEKLKAAFRSGIKIHKFNAETVYGKGICDNEDTSSPLSRYYKTKKWVHATNYGSSARTCAEATGDPLSEAQEFQRIWFKEHPEIKAWQNRISHELQVNRFVRNAFGFRRYYFERIEGLLPEALAWIPQSTVAITINKGLLNLHRNLKQVQLLLQVHDSLVFQYPKSEHPHILTEVKKQLQIVIPYPDPLIIPVNIKTSDKSSGECA